MSLCIVCHEKKATVPDRETMSSRNKICADCHAARLCGDLKHVLALHKKKKEATQHDER
jgi:hypothetical protein